MDSVKINFNFFRSKWFLAIAIPVIGGLIFAFIKIKAHENLVNKEVRELEKRVSEFEKNNSLLEKIISQMTHPSFLEKEARLKLNYKASGEEVVFVYPDENIKTSGHDDFSKRLAQMPNFVKWWYYLLGY